jgi:hypothetical protein
VSKISPFLSRPALIMGLSFHASPSDIAPCRECHVSILFSPTPSLPFPVFQAHQAQRADPYAALWTQEPISAQETWKRRSVYQWHCVERCSFSLVVGSFLLLEERREFFGFVSSVFNLPLLSSLRPLCSRSPTHGPCAFFVCQRD